ncbi:hypothetical protein E4U53_002820 [Claviceps sorghi]|nr:hypothetical protein E4U53_002820 [Claviceps sorghi]
MKFATVLAALATAAMASPTKSLEARCDSCDLQHSRGGYGRYHGQERSCDNWVPVDENGIALDVEAEVCLNLQVGIGLGPIGIGLSLDLDAQIDIALIAFKYPSCRRLVCDPTHSCQKGKPIPEKKCWNHEFDDKYSQYSRYNNYHNGYNGDGNGDIIGGGHGGGCNCN